MFMHAFVSLCSVTEGVLAPVFEAYGCVSIPVFPVFLAFCWFGAEAVLVVFRRTFPSVSAFHYLFVKVT